MKIWFLLFIIFLAGCNQTAPTAQPSSSPATPVVSASADPGDLQATPVDISSVEVTDDATPPDQVAASDVEVPTPSATMVDFWTYPDRKVVTRAAEKAGDSNSLVARDGSSVVVLTPLTDGIQIKLMEVEVTPGSESSYVVTTLKPGKDSEASLKEGEPYLGSGETHREPFVMVMEAFVAGEFQDLKQSPESLATGKEFLEKVKSLE